MKIVILFAIVAVIIIVLCLTKEGKEFLAQIGCDMTDDEYPGHFISNNKD